MKEFLTIDEMSNELKVPLKSLYFYFETVSRPKTYRFGKHIRVTREDFNTWVETCCIDSLVVPDTITMEEIAEKLQLSVVTLRKYRRQKFFPPSTKLSTGEVLVNRSTFYAWWADNTEKLVEIHKTSNNILSKRDDLDE